MRIKEARELLGVTPSADLETIRRRYHRLARNRHPDVGGDPNAFHDLQRAYDVLVDTLPAGLRDSTTPWRDPVTGTLRPRAPREEPAPDVRTIDWDRAPSELPTTLDHELLAVLGATAVPVAQVVALSRGPSAVLNRLVAVLEESLSSTLEVGVPLPGGELGVRITARQRRARRLLLDRPLPFGWVKDRPASDVVVARRPLVHGKDPRVNALRSADVLAEACEAIGWPLHAWTAIRPAVTGS